MGCEHNGGGFYRPRQPKQMAFYQLVERFYPQFKAVYEERYQECYGFWRPVIGTVVEQFLECGDLSQGFARACLCRTADRSAARTVGMSCSSPFLVAGVVFAPVACLPKLRRRQAIRNGLCRRRCG